MTLKDNAKQRQRQRAIEMLSKYIDNEAYTLNFQKSCEVAISALEKQIPKKVIEQTENDREFIDCVCPNCKTTLQQKNKQAKRITIYKYKHCIDCGQALDWGDSDA